MGLLKLTVYVFLFFTTSLSIASNRCEAIFLSKVTLSHIVATSSNFVIGDKKNEMPWGLSLKQDLKRFKDLTSNHIIIMGRKTFQSMYNSLNGKPLPNRQSVVITRDPEQVPIHENVVAVKSIEEAIQYAETQLHKYPAEVFVVGGGEIFSKTYDRADRLYLTLIEKDFEGAVFYPKVDMNKYNVLAKEEKSEAGYKYQFLTLESKK